EQIPTRQQFAPALRARRRACEGRQAWPSGPRGSQCRRKGVAGVAPHRSLSRRRAAACCRCERRDMTAAEQGTRPGLKAQRMPAAARRPTAPPSRSHFLDALSASDPAIAGIISREIGRQRDEIELIASENIVSSAVLEAAGSALTNKYAEGYPGNRYYG